MMFRKISLVAMAFLLQGCTHYVLSHQPPTGGFTKVALRQPLRAVVKMDSEYEADSEYRNILSLLRDSGYFSTLTASSDPDVVISYRGQNCIAVGGPADGFAFFLISLAVTLPSLGMVPPPDPDPNQCWVKFGYEIKRSKASREREVKYPYVRTGYNSTFTHRLLTSPEREKYQEDYLMDQSVAALLSDISAQLVRIGWE